MNERTKELRKNLGLTLEEFGKRLGVTKSAISNIENGNRNLTDLMIVSICREFDVSEEWLRFGTGEMFIPKTINQSLTDFLGNLITEEDSFKKRLIEALASLDVEDWEYLEKLALKLTKKD